MTSGDQSARPPFFSGLYKRLGAPESDQVEAGATGDALCLWQAKEAVRNAELRLTSQAGTLQAFETRATAILGWIALIVSAPAGAVVVSLDAGRVSRAFALSAAFWAGRRSSQLSTHRA